MRPLRLVQPGAGAIRPALLVYNLTAELDQAVKNELGPDVAILNDTRAPSKGPDGVLHHPDYGPGLIDPLPEVLAFWAVKLGAFLSPVVLAGFSAGGKGPRTQIEQGFLPDGICICDGTHASRPPLAGQIDPWVEWLGLASALESAFPGRPPPACVFSHTQIPTSSVLSTRETLQLVVDALAGAAMAPDLAVHGEAPVTSWKVGNGRIYSYPGADAQAHVHQATVVMAPLLRHTFQLVDPSALCGKNFSGAPVCQLPEDFEPPPASKPGGVPPAAKPPQPGQDAPAEIEPSTGGALPSFAAVALGVSTLLAMRRVLGG